MAAKAFVHKNKLKKYVGPPAEPVPADYLECLEIGAYHLKEESYCEAVQLPDDDLEKWLCPKSTYPFAKDMNGQAPERVLRLVICALPNQKFSHQPFQEVEFDQMRDIHDLREDFFQTEDLCGPNLWFEAVTFDSTQGYAIQLDKFNKAVSAFKLSVCYDPMSKITCAVIRVLVNQELEQLRKRVQVLKHYMWHPVMLSLVLAETRVYDIPKAVSRDKDSLAALENDAGVYKNRYFQDSLNPDTLVPSEARDFDHIINGVIPIKAGCDYLLSKSKTCIELLDFLGDIAYSYTKSHPGSDRFGDVEKNCIAVCSSKIAYQRTFATNAQIRCQYVLDRAAALTNQCYTMMGQKDNYLNLRTANVSLEIAEMSREDNLQMKEIALATARDSTDMRSIAVLTMVFLPPTFTATFFSTSFYDFSPDNGKVVSHLHWVYWVVTGGLTLCALGLWFVHMRWGLVFWKRKPSEKTGQDTEKNTIVSEYLKLRRPPPTDTE